MMFQNGIEPDGHLQLPLDDIDAVGGGDADWFVTLETRYFGRYESGDWDAAAVGVWLRDRLDLFKSYTLRSVLAQDRRPDVWFLEVDEDALELVPELLELEARYAFIVLLRTRPGLSRAHVRNQWLASNPHRWASAVGFLTGRCDNDDALARDFFTAALAYAKKSGTSLSRPILLTYAFGAQVVDDWSSFRVKARTTGHFHLVMQSGSSRPSGVYTPNHRQVFLRDNMRARDARVLNTWQPMWLEVVHGNNVANVAAPGPLLVADPAYLTNRFGLDSPE